MKFLTKIQSISDIITNSSSETFLMHKKDAKYYDGIPLNGCIRIDAIGEGWIRNNNWESKDYEDCLKLAISMGGDSDTIAAMAGSIAYAYYEKMPQTIFDQVWDVLPEEMIDIVETFDDVCE